MKESQHQFICVVQIIFPPFISFSSLPRATLFSSSPHTIPARSFYYKHTHTGIYCCFRYLTSSFCSATREREIHSLAKRCCSIIYFFLFFVCFFYVVVSMDVFIVAALRCRQKIIIVKHVLFFSSSYLYSLLVRLFSTAC